MRVSKRYKNLIIFILLFFSLSLNSCKQVNFDDRSYSVREISFDEEKNFYTNIKMSIPKLTSNDTRDEKFLNEINQNIESKIEFNKEKLSYEAKRLFDDYVREENQKYNESLDLKLNELKNEYAILTYDKEYIKELIASESQLAKKKNSKVANKTNAKTNTTNKTKTTNPINVNVSTQMDVGSLFGYAIPLPNLETSLTIAQTTIATVAPAETTTILANTETTSNVINNIYQTSANVVETTTQVSLNRVQEALMKAQAETATTVETNATNAISIPETVATAIPTTQATTVATTFPTLASIILPVDTTTGVAVYYNSAGETIVATSENTSETKKITYKTGQSTPGSVSGSVLTETLIDVDKDIDDDNVNDIDYSYIFDLNSYLSLNKRDLNLEELKKLPFYEEYISGKEDKIIEDFQNKITSLLQSERPKTKDELIKNYKPLNLECNYEIKCLNDKYISIILYQRLKSNETYEYIECINIDLKNRNLIKLRDLLKSDYKEKVLETLKEDINETKENVNDFVKENIDLLKDYINDDIDFYINTNKKPVILLSSNLIYKNVLGLSEFEIK